MKVDKLVIYNDHIEVQRQHLDWMQTVMCPHTGKPCSPLCVYFGEWSPGPIYIFDALPASLLAAAEHQNYPINLELDCAGGYRIICKSELNFADLRHNPNKETT